MKGKPPTRRPAVERLTEALLEHGHHVAEVRDGFRSNCPAHSDRSPSLIYKQGDKGAIVLCESQGCDVGDITAAIGMTTADLFDERRPSPSAPATPKMRQRPEPWPMLPAGWTEAVAEFAFRGDLHRLLEAERAISGSVAVRYGMSFTEHWKARGESRFIIPVKDPNGKIIEKIAFAPRSMRGPGRPGVDVEPEATRWPLRCLDAEVFGGGETVIVTEAEMDALAVRSAGFAAYGGHGANSWDDAYAHELRDDYGVKSIVVIGDRDEPGQKFNVAVVESCRQAGIEARAIELPESLGKKGDVTDYLLSFAAEDRHAAMLALIRETVRQEESGAQLYVDLRATLARFIVLPQNASFVVLSLWILHTYLFRESRTTPYLFARSAGPDCGKTTLANVLRELASEPVKADRISPAALYRYLRAKSPTLLIDQAEDLYGSKRDEMSSKLDAVLCSGYEAGGSIIVCDGDAHEPTEFPTFCPKAIFGIDKGKMPAALRSRCLEIALQPKLPHEVVENFEPEDVADDFASLRDRLSRWTESNRAAVKQHRPELRSSMQNRRGQLCRPLLAVADVIGPDVGVQARDALEVLLGVDSSDEREETFELRALRDVWTAFGENDRMMSKEIVQKLRWGDDSPWKDWGRGRPDPGLNPRDLARLLRGFGIHPKTIRVGEDRGKGYSRDQLREKVARWIPGPEGHAIRAQLRDTASQPCQRDNTGEHWAFDDSASVTGHNVSRIENTQNPSMDGGCHGVTAETPIPAPNPFLLPPDGASSAT